ncbi:MAG: TRAP transporter large permease subunit [Dehalococcoidia bacterium]|nr:TRAP transporter large permease subunit [Dehalococcoidia bacterium]
MIAGIFIGVLTGFPLAFVVGSVGLIVGYLLLGPQAFEIIYSRLYSLSLNYPLLAVPLFTFMGVILQRSGIADGLFDALYLWLGGFRGGLAVATVIFGTVLAACLGVITAAVTMLTLIALTPMVTRGYDKSLACGAVCAGGTLGILIPPSVMLVIYGPMAQLSVGKLFMAAMFPGLLLSVLYCSYVAVRCLLQPDAGPSIPMADRTVPFLVKTKKLAYSLFPPAILIMSVLGAIFFGIAPPTEAASVGAFTATLLTVAYRKFSFDMLKHTALETLRVSSFVLLIGCLSFAFVGVFISLGGADVVSNVILAAPGGRWGAFLMVMIVVFLLGMFIDWIGIVFIMVPILAPIGPALGFDALWFGMMICVNLQMSFMTPPFAVAIFVCRGTAAPELGVTIADIIRGVIPFVIMIIVALVMCTVWPEIILWLPGKMIS